MTPQEKLERIADLHSPHESWGWCFTHDSVSEWCQPMRHTREQKAAIDEGSMMLVCGAGCGLWPCDTLRAIVAQ